MEQVFVATLLALALGFFLARANSCTVAATHRFVVERKIDWILGLGVATSAAALLLYGIQLSTHTTLVLPDAGNPIVSIIIGGLVLGAGALVNGACMLGSISKIGCGNLNFLFTLGGVLFAFEVVKSMPSLGTAMVDGPVRDAYHTPVGLLFLGVFIVGILWGIWRLVFRKEAQFLPLIAIGVIGALMFGSNPNWSYISVLGKISDDGFLSNDTKQELSTLALFAGAVLGAYLKDRFAVVWPGWVQAVRCVLGGILMGIGASLIPGGNDVHLLWTIPSLAIHGVIAYIAMFVAIGVGLKLSDRVVSYFKNR